MHLHLFEAYKHMTFIMININHIDMIIIDLSVTVDLKYAYIDLLAIPIKLTEAQKICIQSYTRMTINFRVLERSMLNWTRIVSETNTPYI